MGIFGGGGGGGDGGASATIEKGRTDAIAALDKYYPIAQQFLSEGRNIAESTLTPYSLVGGNALDQYATMLGVPTPTMNGKQVSSYQLQQALLNYGQQQQAQQATATGAGTGATSGSSASASNYSPSPYYSFQPPGFDPKEGMHNDWFTPDQRFGNLEAPYGQYATLPAGAKTGLDALLSGDYTFDSATGVIQPNAANMAFSNSVYDANGGRSSPNFLKGINPQDLGFAAIPVGNPMDRRPNPAGFGSSPLPGTYQFVQLQPKQQAPAPAPTPMDPAQMNLAQLYLSGNLQQKAADPTSILDIFRNAPGYQTAISTGMEAYDRAASAKGMLNSGAAIKGAQQYGQGLADQNFQNYLNQLSNLAGRGQTAATNRANFGFQGGVAQGDTASNQGSNVANVNMGAASNLANIQMAQAAAAAQSDSSMFGGLGSLVGGFSKFI